MKKVAVIGGAGAMGSHVVRDLLHFASIPVIVADYNEEKAKALCAEWDPKGKRLVSCRMDIRNPKEAIESLNDVHTLINCVQYQRNVDVMKLALEAGAHYVDLGGLFHVTRKQLELHEHFVQRNLSAVVGIGAAPGITNLLTRLAADELDTIEEIHIRVAGVDKTRYELKSPLSVSYSLQTILEEFSMEPAVYTKGKWIFVKPMSGAGRERFPAPVDWKHPFYTLHSEVATLPLSFKGVREVSFKIAFDDDFIEKVRFLRDIGLASKTPMDVQGVSVSPIEVTNRVVMSLPKPKVKGRLKQHEVIRAIVRGKSGGRATTVIADCHNQGMAEWKMGTDTGTGSPPAIAAMMLLKGEITLQGVLPAEIAVPVKPFFEALEKRRMKVTLRKITSKTKRPHSLRVPFKNKSGAFLDVTQV